MKDLLIRLGAYGRPHDASAQGWRGDSLFGWITIIVALILLVVVAQVLLAMRRRSTISCTLGESRLDQLLVIGGALFLFLLVDGVALLRGYDDLSGGLLRHPLPSERPVQVEVLAQQWAWAFRLPGDDGALGTDDDIVTLHTLTLPAGRPAELELRSKDVIHSFSVPQLREKRDAQPGATTELLLEPIVPGTYEIVCSQHCGLNHYKMRGTLEVLDDSAWQAWAHSESQLSLARAGARTKDGMWGWPFGPASGAAR